MPKAKLSDVGLQKYKAPLTGHTDVWDTTLPTFGVRISYKGTKTFVLKVDNSRRSLGRYPILSLSKAREEAKRLLAERTLGKVRPQSITYPQALDLFIAEKSHERRPGTVAEYRRLLSTFPFKGQLTTVTHQELVRRLNKLTHLPSERNHRIVALKVFFNWCMKRRYITDNPTFGLSTRATNKRARILSDEELRLIWRACEGSGTSGTKRPEESKAAASHLPCHFTNIVKLLILTGQRRGEIAALQTSWIQNDTITLPKEITKNGREHKFPIGSLAGQVIEPLLQANTTGTKLPSKLLFKARGKETAFNGWSKSKAALDKLSGVTNWTLHDLRRTFATRLAELGTPIHVIERLLNHVSGTISGVAAIYNRATYFEEMKAAIQFWESRLSSIVR